MFRNGLGLDIGDRVILENNKIVTITEIGILGYPIYQIGEHRVSILSRDKFTTLKEVKATKIAKRMYHDRTIKEEDGILTVRV